MSHPPKLFNGGTGGFGFEFGLGLGERFIERGGFSVNELLERTRPRNNAPPPPRPIPAPIRQAPPPAAKVQPVGILNDIVQNVIGGITGGRSPTRPVGTVADINAQPQSGASNVLNDFILGQTTSRQQRAAAGTPRAGDVFKSLERDVFAGGRIGPGAQLPLTIPGTPLPVGGLSGIFDLALKNIGRGSMLQPIGGPMAGNVVPISCPLPGTSAGIPAGTCLSQFDWENAGSPRGFEIIGFGQDGQAIVKKRGRRRRRRGLTKTQMGQVSWACNLPPGCRKEVLHGIVHG